MIEEIGLNQLTKDELIAACEQFGTDYKPTLSKAALINNLTVDGVTIELIRGNAPVVEDEIDPFDDEPVLEIAPVVVEEEPDLVLVRMTRTNATYEIRGHVFKKDHPFALVPEETADYLIEEDGGFRMASPKEARAYYS